MSKEIKNRIIALEEDYEEYPKLSPIEKMRWNDPYSLAHLKTEELAEYTAQLNAMLKAYREFDEATTENAKAAAEVKAEKAKWASYAAALPAWERAAAEKKAAKKGGKSRHNKSKNARKQRATRRRR